MGEKKRKRKELVADFKEVGSAVRSRSLLLSFLSVLLL